MVEFNNWINPTIDDLKFEYSAEYANKRYKWYYEDDLFPTETDFLEAVEEGIERSRAITPSESNIMRNRSRHTTKSDIIDEISQYKSYMSPRAVEKLKKEYDSYCKPDGEKFHRNADYRHRNFYRERLIQKCLPWDGKPNHNFYYRNEDTVNDIFDGFRNNSPMKMPIALECIDDYDRGKLEMFSGNTRMNIAEILNKKEGIDITVKMILIPVDCSGN